MMHGILTAVDVTGDVNDDNSLNEGRSEGSRVGAYSTYVRGHEDYTNSC